MWYQLTQQTGRSYAATVAASAAEAMMVLDSILILGLLLLKRVTVVSCMNW